MALDHFVDRGARIDLGAHFGQRHQAPHQPAQHRDRRNAGFVEPRQLGPHITHPPADRRLDRAAHFGLAQIGADRVERRIVDLARPVWPCVEKQRELFDFASHHCPVAPARRGDAVRGIARRAQAVIARDGRRQAIGVRAIGNVAGEGHRARRCRGELDDLAGRFDGGRDRDDRVAGALRLQQRGEGVGAFLAGRRDADVARAAE